MTRAASSFLRLSVAILALAVAAACGIEDLSLDGWTCQTDKDCIEGYACEMVQKKCVVQDPRACPDQDGDGHGKGTTCGEGDCNDSNPNVWVSCATCADADGDGYFVGCDAYVTVPTNPDCDDGNENLWSLCPPLLRPATDPAFVESSPFTGSSITAHWTLSTSPIVSDQLVRLFSDATCETWSAQTPPVDSSTTEHVFTVTSGTYTFQVDSRTSDAQAVTSECSPALVVTVP